MTITEKENIEDALENEKNAKVKAVYKDKENNLDLAYQSLEHGVKEDIILNEKPDTNVFSFQMTVENMSARLDEVGGGITFLDENKDKIIGGIAAPFMNDASNEAYSEEVHFELEQIESDKENVNKYILKVIADEDYLYSNDRQYPVTIDPSVTWNGISDMGEAYVLKSSPDTNYYSSGVTTVSVGKGSQGVFRTYFRAMELSDTVSGKYVESAKMTLYENGANTSGVTIQVKPVKASFKCKTLTWANQPGVADDVFTTFKSSGTSDAKKTIDLTQWARNIAKGSGVGSKNYGLLFKAKDESASSYVRFYGARTSVTSKRPKLTVTYYDGPTKPSSVVLKMPYLPVGAPVEVTWEGIESKALDYVQYRVVYYDTANKTDNGTYIGYSDSTKIGTSSSGTKAISGSANWKEGWYRVYVRGVDEGGIKGPESGRLLVVDKTNPVISSASISPATSSTTYSNELPTLKWSVTEKHLSGIQVSINSDDDYTTISTAKSGEMLITGLKSGVENIIFVRAVDRSGNCSAVKTYKYMYDNEVPVIHELTVTPETIGGVFATDIVPEIKYAVEDRTLKTIEYKIGASDWIATDNSTSATIIPDESLI